MAETDEEKNPDPPSLPAELEDALIRYLTEIERVNGADRARYEAVAGRVQGLLAEHDGGHKEIDTHTGETIRPLDPDPENIKLEDIAHGLANVGRFAGQGKDFYSVARHSVHVSHEVEARGGSAEARRYALLHDATEAYLSDVPGPVKKSLPGYKHAEKRLDAVVVDALGLEAGHSERELVEDADGVVNQHELSVQFPGGDHEEPDDLNHDPDAVAIGEDDEALFLARARNLKLQ
jgi:hypothetical protein